MIFNIFSKSIELIFSIYIGQSKKNIIQQVSMRSKVIGRSKLIDGKIDMKETVNEASKLISNDDLFQKVFLKPIEIALKPGPGLPEGYKIALKNDVSANKYTLTNVQAPTAQQWPNLTYEQLIQKNYDNLLSLLKCKEGIQVAICVCMYSQDKKMLKSTLAGVSENIQFFIRSGLSTDQIAVFVIMDGIQKVDPSVVQYFDQLERQSCIMLNPDSEPTGLHDMLARQVNKEDQYQQQVNNINYLLFSPAELLDRQQRRFTNRVAEYLGVRQLSNLVEKLKGNKTLTYDVLDPRIQKFFIEVAKERRKQQYGQDDDQIKNKDNQFFIDNYANDMVKSRPIIMEALVKAKQFCDQYISTRQSLSLLNYFRTSVFVKKNEEEVDPKKSRANRNKNSSASAASQAEMIVDQDQREQTRIQACKMNLFLCTKYKNNGKLSSHNWFFNGFCQELKPKYSVLLDVGLRPEKNALYKMYKYMVNDPKMGGVCGYMGLRIQRNYDELGYNDELNEEQQVDCITRICLKFADIQRAQQLQYHFAHLLDKPFESIFKFIHVLPGAFSAYNMEALVANNLLQEYFKSLADKVSTQTIIPSRYSVVDVILKTCLPDAIYFWMWPIENKSEEQMLYNENIFLAQDRILCMGIHKNGKDMAFIPDAYAWVDPIKNVHTLLGQRKRWINGSFFAFDKVKKQLSEQEVCQVGLRFQMYFLSFMNMLGYVAPALFLFTVSVAMEVFKADILVVYFSTYLPTQVMEGLVYAVNFLYILLTSSIIFFSIHLTNKHKKFVPYIYATATMMGVFSLIVFVILCIDIFRSNDTFLVNNPQFVRNLPFDPMLIDSMRWIILSIIGMYAIPVIIYCIMYRRISFGIDCVFGALAFLFFSPTYLCILNIYALARINDISWGTKGLDANQSTKNKTLEETWSIIRFLHVGKYMLWNIIAAMVLLTLGSDYISRFVITFSIMIILAITLLTKLVFGLVYMFRYYFLKREADPGQDCQLNQKSRVNDLFAEIKPQIQMNVKKNIQRVVKEVQEQVQQKGPQSMILWGGKSNIMMPGKDKQNLKKHFQDLRKLNASRIIKKDEKEILAEKSQFKGRFRVAKSKDKYKRKDPQENLSFSDKQSTESMKMKNKPAVSKDKFKKKRSKPNEIVLKVGGSVSNSQVTHRQPQQNNVNTDNQLLEIEDSKQIKANNVLPPVSKDKFKKPQRL